MSLLLPLLIELSVAAYRDRSKELSIDDDSSFAETFAKAGFFWGYIRLLSS
jgi:hypothetical protein